MVKKYLINVASYYACMHSICDPILENLPSTHKYLTLQHCNSGVIE